MRSQWPAAGETLSPAVHLDVATRNKILLITEGSEPHTLDPQAARDVSEYHIIMGLIEGLVGCHPTDQSKEVPGMADRWEHNDDYSVWTFHIGEDRKWSNFASVIPLFLSEKHIHISDNISGESN